MMIVRGIIKKGDFSGTTPIRNEIVESFDTEMEFAKWSLSFLSILILDPTLAKGQSDSGQKAIPFAKKGAFPT